MSDEMIVFLSIMVVILQTLTIHCYLTYFFTFNISKGKLYFSLLLTALLSRVDLIIGEFVYNVKLLIFLGLFIIIWKWLDGTIYKKIFHYCFLFSYILIQENLALELYNLNQAFHNYIFFGMYVMLTLIFIGLVIFLRHFKVDNNISIPKEEYLLLSVTPVVSIIVLSTKIFFHSSFVGAGYFLLLIFNIVTICFYNFLTEYHYQFQILQLEKMQSDFYREFLKQVKEVSTLRHDLKNILFNINYYAENREYEKIKETIGEILPIVIEHKDYTGNLSIDSILSQKIGIMERLKIDYILDLQVPKDIECSGFELDFCAILGNLLDNAIESTAKIENPKLPIAISIKYSKNQLFFKVINSSLNISQNYNGYRVRSSKENYRYGLGLRSIKDKVKKYKGFYDFSFNDEKFTSTVMIPINTLSIKV